MPPEAAPAAKTETPAPVAKPETAKPAAAAPAKTESAPAEPKPKIAPEMIALRETKRKIETQRAELARERAEFERARAEHAEFAELAKKDPWAFASKLGFSARDVAKRAVDESKETPQDKLLREIKERLDKRDADDAAQKTEAQKRSEAEARNRDVAALKRALDTYPGEFPTLADEDPADVVDAFDEVFARDYEPLGERLTRENVRAIFALLDANLRAFYEAKASRSKPVPAPEPGAAKPAKSETKTKAHALSSLDAAERAPAEEIPQTREERWERAKRRNLKS